MLANATLWVGVGFALFFCLLAYLGVFGKIGSSLDARADKIRAELDEAARLRREAEDLLKTYSKKAKAAEKEAEEIVAAAREEAERIAKDAEIKLKDSIARRTLAAEQKIALAEASAFAEVKSAATEAAVLAAEAVLTERMSGKAGAESLKDALSEVKSQLH